MTPVHRGLYNRYGLTSSGPKEMVCDTFAVWKSHCSHSSIFTLPPLGPGASELAPASVQLILCMLSCQLERQYRTSSPSPS